MNGIYRHEFSLRRNHFYPTLKLDRKMMIVSRCRRKYGAPVTPDDRVLAAPTVSEMHKEKLRAHHAALDPLALKASLDTKLRRFWTLYNRRRRTQHLPQPTSTEPLPNFRQTLG
jgi:hypothetical protein